MTSPDPTSPDSTASELRAYGGEQGADRVARRRNALIEAALDMLGGDASGGSLSVRGVCRQAGLTARYFYESFESADELVSATFDEVIGEISTVALVAFEAGDTTAAKTKGAIGAIVDIIDADRRKGRLLFSQALLSPMVAKKRAESTALFAGLTLQSAVGLLAVADSPELLATANFAVGGFSQMLAAWVNGDIPLDRDGVVESSVRSLLAFAELATPHGAQRLADGFD